MYKPVDPKVNFPQTEEKILEFWQTRDIFKKSVENRDGSDEYIFYDGPPFATGLPHFGHFVPSTIKDIVPRYQTMRGKKVERRFGWDCHGLPVEYEMEKELGISGKTGNRGVRSREVQRGVPFHRPALYQRMAAGHHTVGGGSILTTTTRPWSLTTWRSIWWVVSRLWEKGLIFSGHYILPYCPRCSTVLSNHELNLGGYQQIHDPAITVKFKRLNGSNTEKNTYFLAWTTTPWTLPSNLALAVGPDIEYVEVEDGDEHYILAKDLLGSYYRSEDEYTVVREFKGAELEGERYEPILPYFADAEEKGAFRVYLGDYVSTEEGTGIVHTAPGFGEDDYRLLKDTEVPTVCPVDAEGQFTEEVSDFSGVFVKTADKGIIKKLKEEGKLVKRENYLHNYPHCWRCSSPLIYRAISSWFVDIQKFKQDMLSANDQIHWVPDHLQKGRFGKWLENARDWAISRNRYWGNPIPIWRCDSCDHTECLGSRAELEKKSGRQVKDLHKHFVDEITYPCSCGGTMVRVPKFWTAGSNQGRCPTPRTTIPSKRRNTSSGTFPPIL